MVLIFETVTDIIHSKFCTNSLTGVDMTEFGMEKDTASESNSKILIKKYQNILILKDVD